MSCSSSSSASEEEDEGTDSCWKGGYHAVRVGDLLSGGRYIAQRKLGWGMRGAPRNRLILRAVGRKYVARKIQKSAAQFAQAAIHEIEVHSATAGGDPSNSNCVVQLVDHFKHAGPNEQHLCMFHEFLGNSLCHLIKYNCYKGLELNKVRELCKSILTGLDYLRRELGVILMDLIPENILLFSAIDPAKDPVSVGYSPILERPEGNPNGRITSNINE